MLLKELKLGKMNCFGIGLCERKHFQEIWVMVGRGGPGNDLRTLLGSGDCDSWSPFVTSGPQNYQLSHIPGKEFLGSSLIVRRL
jgi:hypothetical protein